MLGLGLDPVTSQPSIWSSPTMRGAEWFRITTERGATEKKVYIKIDIREGLKKSVIFHYSVQEGDIFHVSKYSFK